MAPVGGPGKEFWVFNRNYENEMRDVTGESTYERAAWRIEISPKVPAEENYFLNIMQIMENNVQKLSTKKIEGDSITGILISNRIVLLSKTSEAINSSVSFSLQEEDSFKILITDLAPGKWQVMKDNKVVIPEASVNGDDGVLYFEGTRGNYTIFQL